MTYSNWMPHPPIYYTIRSIVRWIFWTTIAMGTMFFAAKIATANTLPPCPAIFNIDFTYTATEGFNPDECLPPPNISIDDQGNWWWTY